MYFEKIFITEGVFDSVGFTPEDIQALKEKDRQKLLVRRKSYCTVCNSPNREIIEKEVRAGGNKREIAIRYGVYESALYRHLKNGHMK